MSLLMRKITISHGLYVQAQRIYMQIATYKMNMPRSLKDFILNIYELLTHRNGSQKYRRNSTLIVEEHVRNKRRRFTTREIYFTSRPRAYISTRKNEREGKSSCKGYQRLAFLCDAARKGFNVACFGGWLCAR